MIPLSQLNWRDSDWQSQLKNGFNSAKELLSHLGLDTDLSCEESTQQFAMKVPQSFVARMEYQNRHDPLLLQVLPLVEEQQNPTGFLNDPVGDLNAVATKGLIHKYHGRALLMLTGNCAINCRYCFRRNFPYNEHGLSKADRDDILKYLSEQTDITEIIFSGGDPLAISDKLLAQWLEGIAAIPHIKRIRVHSRLPIVLPDRISNELTNMLRATGKQLCFVIHSNHANELDNDVANALHKLKTAGFTLLNQSVLLKGINDNGQALTTLSERLFEMDVLPYYLHLLDKAKGTSHFEVDVATAIGLHKQLQSQLPGYLVPKLVKEEAGKANKTWINLS